MENLRQPYVCPQGYQFTNAAEILRNPDLWKAKNFHDFQTLMLTVFYPMNRDFLKHHDSAKIDHYQASGDLANMDPMLAIGVLTDHRDVHNGAITCFKYGQGNDSVEHLVWELYDSFPGQVQ